MERYAHHLMKNRRINCNDEEDLVQETFLKLAISSTQTELRKDDMKGYATAIMKHSFYKYLNRNDTRVKHYGYQVDVDDLYNSTIANSMSTAPGIVAKLTLEAVAPYIPVTLKMAEGYRHDEIDPEAKDYSSAAYCRQKRKASKERKLLKTLLCD